MRVRDANLAVKSRSALIAIAVSAFLLYASGLRADPPFGGSLPPPPLPPGGFVVSPATSLQITTTATSVTNCTDYPSALASGVAGHPGYCQYANFEPLFEGLIFGQYWQAVKTGMLPPPFPVTVGRFFTCAAAGPLLIHLSASVQNSILNLPSAASIGPMCAAEWTQQYPANFVSDSIDVILRKYALYLNQFNQSSLRYIPQICAPNRSLVPKGATPPPGVIAQMAAQLESALLGPIIQMKLMWPAQAGTSTECMRPHCNLCSKGWVGIVTLRQRYIDMGGTPFYTRMDKYYLGGSQPNSTDIPAEWTVSAGGMSSDRRWSLAAPVDYQGQCPAVANQPQVCVRAVTNAGKTQFLEQNSQISLLQRLAVTQLASGYTGLYTLWENSLPSTPPISVPPASPPVPLTTTCPTLTLATAGYSCVGEWTWNLIFQ